MLANNLTLDDEEAVQEEFKELQALAVSFLADRHGGVALSHISALKAGVEEHVNLPDVPDTDPVHVKTPGIVSFYHFRWEILG